MLGAIIGGAISALGTGLSSWYASKKSAEAAKKAKTMVEDQKKENQNWYDRRYNEDPLQRTSAQRVLTKTQEMLRDRNKAAAGRAAVMGGTEESVAAEKARNNEALAEAASRIAAQGEARKDAIENQYMATKQGLNQQLVNIEQQRAQNIAGAIPGVASAFGSLGSAVSEAWPDRQVTEEPAVNFKKQLYY